jgi:molybdopterin/thiamine biosynthesis adenylyltransferase
MTRVALVGCGGLGVPAAWTLALGGQRQFRLLDADVVEESNLHRQVLYATPDLGRSKAVRLAEILRDRWGANVEVVQERLTAENADTLLLGCDAALEGSDDAVAKFAVNDWAVAQPRARTAVIAAAIGRRGQWFAVTPESSCYRCLFEEPPPAESLATCSIAGVLGPVTGQVGGYAALSLLNALATRPDAARGALVRFSPRGLQRTAVAIAPDCRCTCQ